MNDKQFPKSKITKEDIEKLSKEQLAEKLEKEFKADWDKMNNLEKDP